MKVLIASLLTATSLATLTYPHAANATPPPPSEVEVRAYSNAELDSLLAPIALYPDTLLTHIFIASTYPLDVVAADRWRQDNQHIDEDDVLDYVEDEQWDPSVKALAPFTDLLHSMADDLDWLASLGDNVISDEARLLARVQVLRQRALAAGNLEDNQYMQVEDDDDVIVIVPRRQKVVYVPYYDPAIVYGSWWHRNHYPVVWHHPRHYRWHRGFYWGPRVSIGAGFYFGGIHWHNRYVVVSHRPVRHYYGGRWNHHVRSHHYSHWRQHQRYSDRRYVRSVSYNRAPVKRVSSRSIQQTRTHRPVTSVNRDRQVRRYSTNDRKVVQTQRSTSQRPVKRYSTERQVRQTHKTVKPHTMRSQNATATTRTKVTRTTRNNSKTVTTRSVERTRHSAGNNSRTRATHKTQRHAQR